MDEFLKKLLKEYSLEDKEISKYSADLSFVLLMSIMGKSGSRLNDQDKDDIFRYYNEKNSDAILGVLKSKYTEEEWDRVTEEIVQPMIKDYIENVVKKI